MYYLWYIVKSAFIDFWRYEVMEFWRFIFSDFWVWLGFIILVSMVGGGVIELVKACKRNRRVTVVRMGAHINTTIENATKGEAQNAVLTAAYAPGSEPEQEDQGNV